jgi:hypothetical protein
MFNSFDLHIIFKDIHQKVGFDKNLKITVIDFGVVTCTPLLCLLVHDTPLLRLFPALCTLDPGSPAEASHS